MIPFPSLAGQSTVAAHTFQIEPFDLYLHNEETAMRRLETRFATFLRGLDVPCRIIGWHTPASLRPLIDLTLREAALTDDPWRSAALMQYRQWYEGMESAGHLRSTCSMTVWTDPSAASALAATAASAFGVSVTLGAPPAPLLGDYRLSASPHWHLTPRGRPAGRDLVCLLGSYEFRPLDWSFFNPLGQLFGKNLPLGFCVDISKTWNTPDAVAKLEGVITALSAHIASQSGLDSGAQRQIQECHATLADLHNGQALHEVQIKIALLAPDAASLRKRVSAVRAALRSAIGLRVEIGADQITAARYFSDQPTEQIDPRPSPWPMLSAPAALTLGFLGMRRLAPRPGIIRGINTHGQYPYIYDDWETSHGKKATHEVWVGQTGMGKTFALNCFLARSLAHYSIPFDLLEPMGHGRLLAQVFHIDPFIISARRTCFNPHDPMYASQGEQIAHVTRLYETFLQRKLGGSQEANNQRSLLADALTVHYQDRDLAGMTPDQAPLVGDVIRTLSSLGHTPRVKEIARQFAEEIAGLATGSGPFAHFLDGFTNVDFSIAHQSQPRIFCFHEMENDPILIAIAYSQVLATLARTALADEDPRIIAVDEVWRMSPHPGLMTFLLNAVKTFRTRRKKVILIDQGMRFFLENDDTRKIFENCPIRVIFSQKGGEDVFASDPAFTHLTGQHRAIISGLGQRQFIMETPEGLYHLTSQASPAEQHFFGHS